MVLAALKEAGEELVGEAAAGDPVQRLVPVAPVIEERQAVAALDDIHRITAADLRRDFEAAREYDAIDLIFNAIGDDALLRQPVDTLRL